MEQIDSKGIHNRAGSIRRSERGVQGKACCQNKFCVQCSQDQRILQALELAPMCVESDAAAVSEAAEATGPGAWGSKRNDGMRMRAVWL